MKIPKELDDKMFRICLLFGFFGVPFIIIGFGIQNIILAYVGGIMLGIGIGIAVCMSILKSFLDKKIKLEDVN